MRMIYIWGKQSLQCCWELFLESKHAVTLEARIHLVNLEKNGFNSITYWENFLGVKTEEKTVCYQNHLSGRSDIYADFNDENLTSKLSFWHDRNWPQLIRLRKWVCSMFMVTFCEITIDKIGKMVTLVTILIELPEWSCTGKDQQWWWWSRLLWQWQPWL